MIKMTMHGALCQLCKATNKYGLYLSFDSSEDFSPEDHQKACPFLDFSDVASDNEDWQALMDEHMFVVCDTYEECYSLFESVVGDEGATKTNSYNGDCRVFAMTINNNGEIENTNT